MLDSDCEMVISIARHLVTSVLFQIISFLFWQGGIIGFPSRIYFVLIGFVFILISTVEGLLQESLIDAINLRSDFCVDRSIIILRGSCISQFTNWQLTN